MEELDKFYFDRFLHGHQFEGIKCKGNICQIDCLGNRLSQIEVLEK